MPYINEWLIRAQLENSASDLSPTATGLIYFNTSTSLAKVYNGAGWKIFVDTDSSQALTNKTIDSDNNVITNIVDADIKSSAAISYSKLALTGALLSADIAAAEKTGSGDVVLQVSPSITTPVISGGTISSPTITGTLLLQNPSGAQPELHLSEDPDNGTNVIKIKAPAALAGDVTLTLPDTDGDANQALTTNGSGVLSWTSVALASTATPTAQGLVTSYFPTIQSAVKTVSSADYTILDTDGYETVLVTTGASTRTITLPTAADNTGRELKIKKVDSGAGKVTIDGEGSETIDGKTVKYLTEQYDEMTIVCNGTAWFIVATQVGLVDVRIVLKDGNGHGSTTGTKIRKFSSGVLANDRTITYADTVAAGSSFTINQDGIYNISYTDRTSSDGSIGISRNSSQLTTDINTITAADRLAITYLGIGASSTQLCGTVTATLALAVGDVIRPHTDGVVNGTGAWTQFVISRVAIC